MTFWRFGLAALVLGLALLTAAGCARGAAPAAVKAVPLRARPAPVVPGRVTASQVRTADGSKVTIATFTGSVSYVLHNGSVDPGKLLAGEVTAGPKITGAGRARLLAAFNGGFLMKSLAGGYEQEGTSPGRCARAWPAW